MAVSNYGVWCPGAESNHRHADFQSAALPTELPGRLNNALLISHPRPSCLVCQIFEQGQKIWPVTPPGHFHHTKIGHWLNAAGRAVLGQGFM